MFRCKCNPAVATLQNRAVLSVGAQAAAATIWWHVHRLQALFPANLLAPPLPPLRQGLGRTLSCGTSATPMSPLTAWPRGTVSGSRRVGRHPVHAWSAVHRGKGTHQPGSGPGACLRGGTVCFGLPACAAHPSPASHCPGWQRRARCAVHQQLPPSLSTFPSLSRSAGAAGVPEEAFVAIETLLPTGKGKFLELWAPREVRRPGWTHLVEVGGAEA